MDSFLRVHDDAIVGTLSTFDRLVFKGHLTTLFPQGRFSMFLGRQGVLLKDFKPYVKRVWEDLKAHAQQVVSKGFDLIPRFSEAVDLVMLPGRLDLHPKHRAGKRKRGVCI